MTAPRRFHPAAALLAALPVLAAFQASPLRAGEDLLPSSEEPIVVHALSVERDMKEGVIVGEGAVDILYGDLRLRADRVVVNEATRQVVADGNVILDEGDSRLQGEHMEVDLESRTGFVEEGFGFAQSYFFTGRKVEKAGPSQYRVLDGTFTSCEGTTPDWKFKSREAFFEVDRYVTARHPTMWARKIPVLYLPYAAFPLKRDRATGLLIPEVRVNEIDGLVIRNSFFWAPVDNFDATLSLDYRRNVGWGPGLEMRYITAPGTFGNFDSSYINEKDGGDRWSVALNHQHALPYEIKGQVDLALLSDRDYIRRYGDTLDEQATEKTSSSVYFSRSWASYDLVLSGLYEESLVTDSVSSITRVPELRVNRTRGRLLDTDLFWRLSFEGAYLRSESVQEIFTSPGDETGGEVLLAEEKIAETTRLDLYPELSWPLTFGSWGSFTPAFAYRATYYSEDTEGASRTRLLPLFNLSLDGPRVYRIFETGGVAGGIEKIKHLIEPRVSYAYIPEEDQSELPQFDSIDFIPRQNALFYSLTNTLLGKLAAKDKGGKPRTEELLRVKLSQSYNFDAVEVAGEQRPFSPLGWDAVARPARSLDVRWKGDFDFYDSEVGYQDVSLTWTAGRGTMLRGEWRTFKGGGNDFLDVWLRIPTGPLFWDMRSRFNIEADEFVENSASVKYVSQCWDLTLGYVQWPEEYEFRIQLGLKGIGNVLSSRASL